MRSNVHSSPDDIDITSLWGALMRSMPRIAIFAVLAGLTMFASLQLVDPVFTSEAQLQIGGKGITDPFRDPKAGSASPDAVAVKVDKEAVATQVFAIKSRDLAARLIGELKLNTLPEFNSALGGQGFLSGVLRTVGLAGPRPGESETDRVLSAYTRRLQVYQGKETRVITIEFSSSDPQLAAAGANKLAELYQDWLRSQGVSLTADASDWLRPQIEKLAGEVAQAEAEAEQFRNKAGLFVSAGKENVTLNQQQLSELSSELSKAKALRSEVEARARAAREMMRGGSADALPDVQKSPTMQALVQSRSRVERTIAELSASLLPAHPRMQQLAAELAGLKRQIDGEAAKLVDSIEKEARVAAMREEAVRKSLDEIKARVISTSADEVRLKQLDSLAKAKRKELEGLQERYEAARSRGDARAVPLEATLISRARPSSVPTFPKVMPLSLLAFAGAFLLGLVGLITRELLSGARGGPTRQQERPAQSNATPEEAMPAPRPANGPALAVLPVAGQPAAPAPEPPSSDRYSRLGSIGEAGTHIAARAPGTGAGYRTLIVDGGTAAEAATRARDLATALAGGSRKSLIVDWSPAGNGFALALGLETAPGMAELLDGEASFEDVIQRLPQSTVHVITAGSPRPAGDPVDADRMNLILDALDEAYDYIVIAGDAMATRELFATIQGRVDAGILVGQAGERAPATDAGPGTFLGFDVTDIDVIRLEEGVASAGMAQARKLRLARSGAATAPAGA